MHCTNQFLIWLISMRKCVDCRHYIKISKTTTKLSSNKNFFYKIYLTDIDNFTKI